MSALSVILAALPSVLDLVAKIWRAYDDPSAEKIDEAWSDLKLILPGEVEPFASALEPYFRAAYQNFDSIEGALAWLSKRLHGDAGITLARVDPWALVEVESHLQADAWLAAHVSKMRPSSPHEPEPLPDPWPPEAATRSERKP